MHFIKLWLGNIAQITAQMSMIDEAIFMRLMRRYHETEAPIPADLDRVFRMVGAKRREEKAAVVAVLASHFVAQPDGWHRAEWDRAIADATTSKSKVGRATLESGLRHKSEFANEIKGDSPYKIEDTSKSKKNKNDAEKPRPVLIAQKPEATLFDYWPATLATKTGKTEAQCRTLIGMWRKHADGDEPRVLHLLREAHRQNISEPVAWITKALQDPEETFTDYRKLYPK